MSEIINDINLPKPIYDAMCLNKYDPGKTDYSASSITLGPKEYWGKKRNKDFPLNAGNLWASFTGILMHSGLEVLLEKYEGEGTYMLEHHVEVWHNDLSSLKLDGDRIVGGTVDGLYINGSSVVLFDYKTMSTASIIDEKKINEWTEKANFYRWILKSEGIDVSRMVYLPMFKDWTLSKAMRSKDVNDIPCPKVELEIWSTEKIEQWVFDKISYIEQYKDTPLEDIPYCNSEQRWEGKKLYKVGKLDKDGKVKRALPKSSFETPEEAYEKLSTLDSTLYGIKVDGGIPKKCKDWCILSKNGLCDFNDK